MTELGPREVEVHVESRAFICEGMSILVPMVTAIDAGEQCTKRQVNQVVRDAIDDWYRERRHEQEEDQEAEAAPDEEAEAPAEGRPGDEEAPRVSNPGPPTSKR